MVLLKYSASNPRLEAVKAWELWPIIPSTTTAGHTGPSGSSMEEPAMVPHSTGHAGGLPNPHPTQRGSDHTNTPGGCTSSTVY